MKDSQNRTKKQLLKRVWEWIKIGSLLLGIFCGIILVYRWWDRQQKLERLQVQIKELQEQAQQQYQLQDVHLISTNDLVNSPKVQDFFSDLLTTYAKKFAKIKNISISHLPLKFESLYYDPKTGNGYGEMGRCWKEPKLVKISLNRLYLLNKLGHDRYSTSNPKYGDYTYLDISFDKMIDTCSHELAHYIQFVKYGRSSCESDLKLENGNYSEKLAKEHEEFSKEIYQLVKNSDEYSEWEKRWKEI